MKKTILITILFLCFGVSISFAQGLSPHEKALYEIMKSWQAMDGIMTDALLLIGWGDREDKDAYRQELQKYSPGTTQELEDQVAIIKAQKVPSDLKGLQDIFIKTLQASINIYQDIGKESDEKTSEDFEKFYKHLELLNDDYGDALSVFLELNDLPPGYQTINEELVFFRNNEDEEFYQSALDLMDQKEYAQALKFFEQLIPKYNNTPTEDILVLKITDCHFMFDSDVEITNYEENEKIYAQLTQIVDGNRYSPVLQEAFLKWRAKYQEMNHGMSNFSVIPNDEYNIKRWHVFDVIVKHIEENPKDNWARIQAFLLASADNINRGTPYGNTNLIEMARLYSDILDKKEDENKESPQQENSDRDRFKAAIKGAEAPTE